MSLNRELDRRVSRIDRLLQNILRLFLIGELSAFLAKLRAREIIEAEYRDFMTWFEREYGTPPDYNREATRIKKVLHEILEDFENVIQHRPDEEQEKRKLRFRVYLIAIGLIFSLHRESVITLALIVKAPWIRWNTQEDPSVCQTCESLKGLYRPHEYPERPHPSCRCFASIEYS